MQEVYWRKYCDRQYCSRDIAALAAGQITKLAIAHFSRTYWE
ncbi:hypothetical protein [Nostoc sp.]